MTDERVELVDRALGMLVQAAREREAAIWLPDCIDGAQARLEQAKVTVLAAIDTRSEGELREALDIAAGRLKWIAEHEPGSRPDVNWKWAKEARAALSPKQDQSK